ncbi:MAG: PAS domain S-box protein [Rhodospirillales bacterium]|nr:PAS domain S-box protein [Rhodospirillales bacterium]
MSVRQNLRILYIEDDEHLCSLFKERMQQDGYTVEYALTGASGLKKFHSGSYDLLALDFDLPDMRGLEIAQEVLKLEPKIPIVMITGRGSEHVAAEALSVGVSSYVIKNNEQTFLEQLPATISRLLENADRNLESAVPQDNFTTSEDFHRILTSFAPVAIFVHADETVVFANPAAVELMGAESPDDLIGKASLELHHPNQRELIKQRITEMETTGKSAPPLELQYMRLDGSFVDVETRAASLNYQGRRARMVMVQDISDRKKAESILTDTIESIPDGIAYYDVDDRLALFNENFVKGRDELKNILKLNMTFEEQARIREKTGLRDKYLKDKKFSIEERLKRHLNPGKPHIEYRPDGRIIQSRETKTPNGGITIIRTDVTDFQAALDNATNSDKFLRTFLDNIPAAVNLKDPEGRFLLVNKTWNQWFNPDNFSFIGKTRSEVFPAEHVSDVSSIDKEVFKSGNLVERELQTPLKNGIVLTTIMQKFPITNSDGEITAIGTINTDISERQKHRDELQKAHDLLESRVQIRTKNLDQQITERKQIEQELVEQQERLQGIMDSVVDGIITISDKGKIQSFNKAAETIFGYQVDEVIGKNINILMPNPDRRKHNSYLKNYHATGERKIIGMEREVTGLRKNGTTFPMSLAVSELKRYGKSVFTGIVRDITDRKMGEELVVGSQAATEEERRKLQSAIDSLHEGFAYFDADDKLSNFNVQFQNRQEKTPHLLKIGLTFEEYVRQRVEIGQLPNTIGREEEFIKERMARHENPQGSAISQHSDGTWLLVNETRTSDGGTVLTTLDISDLKNAELALRNSQETLLDAADSFAEGFALYDENDKLVFFNQQYKDAMDDVSDIIEIGMPFEHFLRTRAERSTRKDGLKRDESYIQERLAWHHDPRGHLERTYPNGKSVQISGFKTKSGGTAIVRTDITELKRIQNELSQSRQDAEAANQAKSEFLSSMSHELRTPLNAVLGFSQMLEYNPDEPLTESQKNSVIHIKKGGGHLLELIDEVLDLAKIEAGKIDLTIENVEVAALIDDCISSIGTILESREIEPIDRSLYKGDEVVRADVTRFRQILLNLLTNGVKYNRHGGKLTISTTKMRNNFLKISVTDTGEGIQKDKHSELFQPFSRLGQETTEIEGTGIGLVVKKRLVEEMEGNIGFESEVGRGSTFWFELPLSQEVNIVEETTTNNVQNDIFRKLSGKVLYVEDNPANLDLMKMVISRVDGLSMISANNAESGIELVLSENPDLVIMDINLPGMNGFEALEKLNEINEIWNNPVIALSANATKGDIDKGRKAGFYDYLTKPIDVSVVLQTIEDALGLNSET